MCNPRRIRVVASRQLDEAWQHEVSRTIELSAAVTGEARVRQPLGTELSGPTLRALEMALADPESGWSEVEVGYRLEVEGGAVTYLADDHALEIVATESDEVRALGEATRQIEGRVTRNINASGEGSYYDDGYGGRDESAGESQAQREAGQKLERLAGLHLERARRNAERAATPALENEARERAAADLSRRLEARRSQLEGAARHHLESVGQRGRHAFHRALARAYRDAILAYARNNNAAGLVCSESDDVIDIEFRVTR